MSSKAIRSTGSTSHHDARRFQQTLDDVWTRHAPDRVAADPVRPPLSAHVEGAGPERYWRLHGSPLMDWTPCDDAALHDLTVDVRAARDAGHACQIVFDTASGAAIRDALRFKALIGAPVRKADGQFVSRRAGFDARRQRGARSTRTTGYRLCRASHAGCRR